jgi:hypothetical protein
VYAVFIVLDGDTCKDKVDNLCAWFFLVVLMAGRLYAMEKGLKIPANERTKNTNALLASLMNQLEKVLM